MDKDRLYPEQFCDLAGVLPSRTAKTCEPVQKVSAASTTKGSSNGTYTCFPGGVSSRLGQGADGSAHGLVCDLDESIHQVNEPRQTVF
jgi:hypothetical protein